MKRSLAVFASLALAATALLSSCDSGKATNSDGGGASVSAPTFNPAGGTFSATQSVTLSSAASGATIYYTTSGSTPTTSSTQYTGAITVGATETIQAIAVKSGTSSTVASATFTISSGTSSTIPWNTSITYGSLTDSRDSKVYKTVKIGTQTWMAENLTFAGTSEAQVGVWYNNSADSGAKYGRLYMWSEVMAGHASSTTSPSGVQGVCPNGWHVPSDTEWSILTTYIGGESSAGTKLKSTSGWYSSENGADTYGFRVLPAGDDVSGLFSPGDDAYFWSASEFNADYAWDRSFYGGGIAVSRSDDYDPYWFSLRCLAD
jgi:uncharacterized protein (TIGR02145 family)